MEYFSSSKHLAKCWPLICTPGLCSNTPARFGVASFRHRLNVWEPNKQPFPANWPLSNTYKTMHFIKCSPSFNGMNMSPLKEQGVAQTMRSIAQEFIVLWGTLSQQCLKQIKRAYRSEQPALLTSSTFNRLLSFCFFPSSSWDHMPSQRWTKRISLPG